MATPLASALAEAAGLGPAPGPAPEPAAQAARGIAAAWAAVAALRTTAVGALQRADARREIDVGAGLGRDDALEHGRELLRRAVLDAVDEELALPLGGQVLEAGDPVPRPVEIGGAGAHHQDGAEGLVRQEPDDVPGRAHLRPEDLGEVAGDHPRIGGSYRDHGGRHAAHPVDVEDRDGFAQGLDLGAVAGEQQQVAGAVGAQHHLAGGDRREDRLHLLGGDPAQRHGLDAGPRLRTRPRLGEAADRGEARRGARGQDLDAGAAAAQGEAAARQRRLEQGQQGLAAHRPRALQGDRAGDPVVEAAAPAERLGEHGLSGHRHRHLDKVEADRTARDRRRGRRLAADELVGAPAQQGLRGRPAPGIDRIGLGRAGIAEAQRGWQQDETRKQESREATGDR